MLNKVNPVSVNNGLKPLNLIWFKICLTENNHFTGTVKTENAEYIMVNHLSCPSKFVSQCYDSLQHKSNLWNDPNRLQFKASDNKKCTK